MTKKDIAYGLMILGSILFVVGSWISIKGLQLSKIPDHSHIYSEGRRYYYQNGLSSMYPPVEVTQEQYDIYKKYNNRSKVLGIPGVFLGMVGIVMIIVLRVMDEMQRMEKERTKASPK